MRALALSCRLLATAAPVAVCWPARAPRAWPAARPSPWLVRACALFVQGNLLARGHRSPSPTAFAIVTQVVVVRNLFSAARRHQSTLFCALRSNSIVPVERRKLFVHEKEMEVRQLCQKRIQLLT